MDLVLRGGRVLGAQPGGAWMDVPADVRIADGVIAEIGAGLRWRLSDRIALFGDLRFGSRDSFHDNDETLVEPDLGATGRSLMPEGEEEYSRIRLGGMITF